MEYEYEVAFSFCHQDEKIAFAMNDLLQGRYKTFIYSQHQKTLAGTDGESKFREVFSKLARVVVVLYRDSWGTSSFTRMEMEAIRERAYHEGYEFTLFVQVEKPEEREDRLTMPAWLPKYRLYGNLNRFGLPTMVATIETRLEEVGGQVSPENLEERAGRMKRDILKKKEIAEFFSSNEAYKKANEEARGIIELLKKVSLESNDKEIGLSFIHDTRPNLVRVKAEYFWLTFGWACPISNSLRDSGLRVSWGTLPNFQYTKMQESTFSKHEYRFGIENSLPVWIEKTNAQEFFTSDKLVEFWMKKMLDKIHVVLARQHETI